MRSVVASLCFLGLVALLATTTASANVFVDVQNHGHADYCYYFDGGKCNNEGNNLAWQRGETYELFINADPTQPLRVTTDIDGLQVYAGANATDVFAGTILVTIPENEELNLIYLKCFYHNFFIVVDIIDAPVVTDIILTNFDATPCYYVNSGTECSPELTWYYGQTYRLHVNTSQELAMVCTADKDSTTPTAYAGSDSVEPVWNSIVTITIPETETLTNLYLKCVAQPWWITVKLEKEPESSSTGGAESSSTGTDEGQGSIVYMNMSATDNCFKVKQEDLLGTDECTTELGWLAGTTYVLNLDQLSMGTYPFNVLTAPKHDAPLYAGAVPNTVGGMTSGIVTITIPSDEKLTNLYLWCMSNDFYVVVNLSGSVQTGGTGGDVATSTGGAAPQPLDDDDDDLIDDDDDDDDGIIDIDDDNAAPATHNTAALVVTQLFAASLVSLLALL